MIYPWGVGYIERASILVGNLAVFSDPMPAGKTERAKRIETDGERRITDWLQ